MRRIEKAARDIARRIKAGEMPRVKPIVETYPVHNDKGEQTGKLTITYFAKADERKEMTE